MIYGFDILSGIPEDLAYRILSDIQGKLSVHYYNMPINNSIRGIMINSSFNQYFLWISINAGILMRGKETIDIDFTGEPDFSMLEEKFKINAAEIFGKSIAERLPPLCEWGVHIMRYGMDIEAGHISEIMRVFAKTNIPSAHLRAKNAATMIKPYDYPLYRGNPEIYPKAELIRLGKIEYKGLMDDVDNDNKIEESRDIIRMLLVHKRGDMGYARRIMKRFEMDIWRLESHLNPLVVTNVFIKSYLDAIGGGDFYKYDKAVEIIENKIPNFQNRKTLLELLNDINKKGSVLKALESSSDKRKFRNDLKLLRDTGINGALLDPYSRFEIIKNPIDEIYEKCNMYSS